MQKEHIHAVDISIDVESRDESHSPLKTTNNSIMTLHEPVRETIKRDLRIVYAKLRLFILKPDAVSENRRILADWDLWGPFAIYLIFAL